MTIIIVLKIKTFTYSEKVAIRAKKDISDMYTWTIDGCTTLNTKFLYVHIYTSTL